jgi:hypothetical protein
MIQCKPPACFGTLYIYSPIFQQYYLLKLHFTYINTITKIIRFCQAEHNDTLNEKTIKCYSKSTGPLPE